jgi:hypothetical protein
MVLRNDVDADVDVVEIASIDHHFGTQVTIKEKRLSSSSKK